MEKIRFQFPVFLYQDEDPDSSEIATENAVISPIRLDAQPYEISLSARGYRFHLIFGKQCHGNFLCIPDWNIGCELSYYNDIFWNEESLSSATESSGRIDYNDISAICYALKTIEPHLIQ